MHSPYRGAAVSDPDRKPWYAGPAFHVLVLAFNLMTLAMAIAIVSRSPTSVPRCVDTAMVLHQPPMAADSDENKHVWDCHPDALLTHEAIDKERLVVKCTCMVWRGEPHALVNEGSRR